MSGLLIAFVALVHALARQAGMNADEIGRSAAMSWDQVREAANSKLVTIGAHTFPK